MIDPTLTGALNNQYNFERYSEAIYTAMAGALDALNLVGMAKYLRGRAGEEHAHAEKFAAYILDRGALLTVDALPKPELPPSTEPVTIGLDIFTQALEHERKVSTRIELLYQVATQLGDGRTNEFLHWFLHEQVEEERSLEEIITRFKLAGTDGSAILLIDHWLGE